MTETVEVRLQRKVLIKYFEAARVKLAEKFTVEQGPES